MFMNGPLWRVDLTGPEWPGEAPPMPHEALAVLRLMCWL